MKKNILATVATAAAISTGAVAAEPPRGMDVRPTAAHCRVGTFPQTTKAGPYNVLCEVMEDSEKCLAFIKGRFAFDGQKVTVQPFHPDAQAKAQYCLDVLKRDLGLKVHD